MNENEKILVSVPVGISVKIRNTREENAFWRFDSQAGKIFIALENADFENENFDIELTKLNAMFEILILMEMISPEVTINSKEDMVSEGIFKF